MSVQTSYPPYMRLGLPGQLADCTVKDTVSGAALEPIPFGVAVVATNIPDYGYALPGSRISSVLVDGSFVAGDSVVITINGTAQPAIVYPGSYAGMIDLIEAQLRGLAYVENVNTTQGGVLVPDFTLNVVVNPPATSGITSFVITGGSFLPMVTITQSSYNEFFGVCQRSSLAAPHFPNVSGTQPFQGYAEGSCLNVLRDGRIYVVVEEAVTKGSAVFVRIVEGAQGQYRGSFRGTAGTSEAVAAPLFSYASNAAAGEIAVVQINP